MASLPDGVTEDDVQRALREAHRHAESRTRRVPALTEGATDAATDAVLWCVNRFDPARGDPFGAFVATTVKKFVWRFVCASAAKHKNRPGVEEMGDGLRESLAAPDRCARDDGRDYRLPDAVRELPTELRDVVRLFYVDGYDLRECGLLMGMTMESVRRRLQHAAKLLGSGQTRPDRAAGTKRMCR